MEFFQKNPDNKLEQQLLAVFTDITCSELKPEATLEQINQLPGYFVNLATQLKTVPTMPGRKNSVSRIIRLIATSTCGPIG